MAEVRRFLPIADFMVRTETFKNIIMSIIEQVRNASRGVAAGLLNVLFREREGVGIAPSVSAKALKYL